MMRVMNGNQKIPASVGILTLNSAKGLKECLESVRDFEDIFICDGNSTDGTQELARSLGVRVEKQFDNDLPNQRITHFAEACNRAMSFAKYQWYLRLDTDERLSAGAVEEIRRIVSDPNQKIRVWKLPRAYVWRGVVIEHAMTYPNNQIRFYHRGAVEKWVKISHEKTILRKGETVGTLRHPMLVVVADTYEEWDKSRFARAMKWDRLHFEATTTPLTWAWGLIHTAITMARFGWRLLKLRLFARGTKLPLSYELWRYKYLFAANALATRIMIEKLLRRSQS